MYREYTQKNEQDKKYYREDQVLIDKKEYDDLLNDQLMLQALEDSGVDNWGWYGEAMALYRQWKEEVTE